jgi:hypothetical protein
MEKDQNRRKSARLAKIEISIESKTTDRTESKVVEQKPRKSLGLSTPSRASTSKQQTPASRRSSRISKLSDQSLVPAKTKTPMKQVRLNQTPSSRTKQIRLSQTPSSRTNQVRLSQTPVPKKQTPVHKKLRSPKVQPIDQMEVSDTDSTNSVGSDNPEATISDSPSESESDQEQSEQSEQSDHDQSDTSLKPTKKQKLTKKNSDDSHSKNVRSESKSGRICKRLLNDCICQRSLIVCHVGKMN